MKKILAILLIITLIVVASANLASCNQADERNDVFVFSSGEITGLTDYGKTLSKITIPSKISGENVTSIRKSAFTYCENLNSIEIGDEVTSIGEKAFLHCVNLTSVVIGKGLTSIGDNAFSECYRLVEIINKSEQITIEKASEENGGIGVYALSVINASDNDLSKVSIDEDGFVFYINGQEKILVGYNGQETAITLPNGVTKINEYAFFEWQELTNLIIPDTVVSIGKDAFNRCTALESVQIPNAVTSVGDRAFAYCENLTSVEIGNSVKTIGKEAFYACYGLTLIVIPDSVTVISSSAFSNCFRLASVIIGKSVTSIGSSAFSCCYVLGDLIIPESVIKISNAVFSDCRVLANVYCYAKSQPSGWSSNWKGWGCTAKVHWGYKG